MADYIEADFTVDQPSPVRGRLYRGRFHCRSTEPGAWQIIMDDNGNDAFQHGGVYVLYESTTPQERYTSPTLQPALTHLMQLLVYCHSARFVLVYCSGVS